MLNALAKNTLLANASKHAFYTLQPLTPQPTTPTTHKRHAFNSVQLQQHPPLPPTALLQRQASSQLLGGRTLLSIPDGRLLVADCCRSIPRGHQAPAVWYTAAAAAVHKACLKDPRARREVTVALALALELVLALALVVALALGLAHRPAHQMGLRQGWGHQLEDEIDRKRRRRWIRKS